MFVVVNGKILKQLDEIEKEIVLENIERIKTNDNEFDEKLQQRIKNEFIFNGWIPNKFEFKNDTIFIECNFIPNVRTINLFLFYFLTFPFLCDFPNVIFLQEKSLYLDLELNKTVKDFREKKFLKNHNGKNTFADNK